MKYTGKRINGVKLYSDPECSPNTLFILDGNYKSKQPKRSTSIQGIFEPPKSYGFFHRIWWHIWEQW